MTKRYNPDTLRQFAASLLEAAGLTTERAGSVAAILLEGDLLGHTTHGLQLLGPYLKSIESGGMALVGEPDVLSERAAAQVWDGKYLPGPWLVERAFDEGCGMAQAAGTGSVVIRRCHHIACLAAYLRPIAEKNLVGLLICSDPANRAVAPHGGTTPVYSPNPVAASFPTDGDPVIMDVSMSTTTNGLCMRTQGAGKKLPHPWVKDASGNVTDDPSVVFADPPGSILPLGGVDAGHKGYALGLLVEALTAGLGGYGRADEAEAWGASVFVQVIDPEAFGGAAPFTREMGWLADACKNSKPAPGGPDVRLPGQAGLERRRQALAEGVELYPGIMSSLTEWAAKYGIDPPPPAV